MSAEPNPLGWHIARAVAAGVPAGVCVLVFYRGPAAYLALLAFPLASFGLQTASRERRLTWPSTLTLAAGLLLLAAAYALLPT